MILVDLPIILCNQVREGVARDRDNEKGEEPRLKDSSSLRLSIKTQIMNENNYSNAE